MANTRKLKECPRTPNCVSTQTDQSGKKMAPISFSGDPLETMAIVKKEILALPKTRLIEETHSYLHFTFTSKLFRFVDDVEFLIDSDAKLIHFRSASRKGTSDLGANRKRMKQLTALIQQAHP